MLTEAVGADAPCGAVPVLLWAGECTVAPALLRCAPCSTSWASSGDALRDGEDAAALALGTAGAGPFECAGVVATKKNAARIAICCFTRIHLTIRNVHDYSCRNLKELKDLVRRLRAES